MKFTKFELYTLKMILKVEIDDTTNLIETCNNHSNIKNLKRYKNKLEKINNKILEN